MTKVIADVGSNWRVSSNHDENLNNIRAQVVHAKQAGAWAVKFQMYTAKELYGRANESVDRYAMPRNLVQEAYEICQANDVSFMCTAFSVDGYKYIDPFVKVHKIASAEATDPTILRTVNEFERPFLVSIGAIRPEEVTRLQYMYPHAKLMNCVSNYPSDPVSYVDHIKATEKIIQFSNFNLSDHTHHADYTMAYFARYRQADYVEVHFDYNRSSDTRTPDSCVSRDTDELATYCQILSKEDPNDQDLFIQAHSRKYDKELDTYVRPL